MAKIDLKKVKQTHERRILKDYKNAIGVGISEQTKNGIKTGKTALTIYVTKKQSVPYAQRADLDSALKGALAGEYEIDIKEIGTIYRLAAVRQRPVQTGASEGHPNITAGTGGPLVRDAHGTLGRVSNNHVYADTNRAQLGDPIYQPGPYDGGNPVDTVGTLLAYNTLDLTGPNTVDGALRSAGPDEQPIPVGLPHYTVAGSTKAVPGMYVVKSGRTTDVTRGYVSDVSLTLLVEYDGPILFENQILIQSPAGFSQSGDSGSAVYEDQNPLLHWVGLLFAGNDDGTVTIANHADAVAAALGVELVTSTPPDPGVVLEGSKKLPILVLIIAAILALIGIAVLA